MQLGAWGHGARDLCAVEQRSIWSIAEGRVRCAVRQFDHEVVHLRPVEEDLGSLRYRAVREKPAEFDGGVCFSGTGAKENVAPRGATPQTAAVFLNNPALSYDRVPHLRGGA